ncbi:hypothetical protein MKK55_24870 [Methylobacterium sp. J-059]|uniref:hypothetical protein n=1 Tax=Methylobacterium sp. J-059 TaxID=2836643 RepID=UPI001FB9FA3C|nr:hypothetical protein [Methylobacterium sp. J-059]MCJ2042164.1 hypothetical protein [Methylobacterium sp. J-059]
MTKRQLRNNVICAIIALVTIFLAAITSRLLLHDEQVYVVIKVFSTTFIAVIGAYLAYCFQRRQAFLASLRELWKEITDAKIEINFYVNQSSRKNEDYIKAYRALSRAMDIVRGVYKNVGETATEVGYYPFQPLHDVRKSLERIESAPSNVETLQTERDRIAEAWNALRWSFLTEFVRVEPERPITKNLASDPRRKRKYPN